MFIFSNLVDRIRQRTPKQMVVAGICTLAVAGSFGLGLAARGSAAAASVRDGSSNSINNGNYHGGAGCLSADECYFDMKENKPGDLQTIYSHFGLNPSDYQRWRTTAKMGKTFKNGDVYVNNQIVMTGANSMGREKFDAQRKPIEIGGKTYYYSATQDAFGSNTDSIDTLVMFDKNGMVETALLTACGNPVWGNKVKPEFGCKALNKTAVSGKKDTYRYTTDAFATKNAKITKVVYDFGDGSGTVTKTNPADAVEHKYTKVGTWTASVTVHVSLPGGQSTTVNCKTTVTVEKEEEKVPAYACEQLIATARDNTNRKFRFSVKASASNGAVLKNADFTLDGNVTVSGVTTKDESGNIYRDYEFNDGKSHKVVAKVNFDIAGSVKSVTCEATVTAGQEPKCTVPGKEHLPPNSPDCVENCPVEGKENLPKNSDECEEETTPPTTPEELPKTGAGSLVGIFASATGAGAAIHRIVLRRRGL